MTKKLTRPHKKGGRPTKYNPEVFAKIEEYMSMCGRENMALPTIEGLAEYIGVISETIKEWTKKYPKFSASIKKLVDRQKNQLMNDGMYGGKEINQAMAIFLLKVNHGMKDTPSHLTQININDMKLEYLDNEGQTIEVAEPSKKG